MKLETLNGVTINTELFREHGEDLVANFIPPSFNARGQARVAEILRQLIPFAQLNPPPKFIFGDLPIPNAFAAPTGELVVTELMEKTIKADGALAAVLGHELGHLRFRHPWLKMATLANLRNIKQILTDRDAVKIVLEANDRERRVIDKVDYGFEIEADEFGFICAFRAGFDFNEVSQMINYLNIHDQHPRKLEENGRVTILKKFISQFRAK